MIDPFGLDCITYQLNNGLRRVLEKIERSLGTLLGIDEVMVEKDWIKIAAIRRIPAIIYLSLWQNEPFGERM